MRTRARRAGGAPEDSSPLEQQLAGLPYQQLVRYARTQGVQLGARPAKGDVLTALLEALQAQGITRLVGGAGCERQPLRLQAERGHRLAARCPAVRQSL